MHAPQQVASPGAQVAGTSRSAADGAPIARARVVAVAANAEPHVALSGADGRYALSNLPPGSYQITITRTGFATQIYGQRRSPEGALVTVAAAQRVADVDVALIAAGHIAGRILDEDGTPFAGATVEALVPRLEAGRDTLAAVASSVTDDRGEFRLYGLPPGQYYVSAADPAFRSVASPGGALRYSATYHPGVPSADQARPVTVLDSGQTPPIEFRLRLVPPAKVSGQLVAFNARPLLGAAIVMSPIHGEGVAAPPPGDASVFPDGRFSFGQVAPGRYQIRARGQTDSDGPALAAVFAIDVQGNDVERIRMTLQPGGVLAGKLTVDARRGSRPPRLQDLRVRTLSADGSSFGDPMTGAVHANGSFTLQGVPRGSHQLAIDGLQAPWVVKEIVYRGVNITDREIGVGDGEQIRGLGVSLTDVSAEVTGIVQNARDLPVADAGVLVVSRLPLFSLRAGRRARVAYTDRDGRFSISGLPAGDYFAIASMSIDESDLGRRDRLRALQAAATPLRLDADDAHATLTLRLASPAALAALR